MKIDWDALAGVVIITMIGAIFTPIIDLILGVDNSTLVYFAVIILYFVLEKRNE